MIAICPLSLPPSKEERGEERKDRISVREREGATERRKNRGDLEMLHVWKIELDGERGFVRATTELAVSRLIPTS